MAMKKCFFMVVNQEDGDNYMPLYDFECEECNYIEEILTSSAGSSEIVLTCPECEKETMKRKVGLSSFQLKGGGWYKDGYTKKPE